MTAHLRWFEEDLGSEVVFWIDERSVEFGHHWFDVAHAHDIHFFQFRLADTEQKFLRPPPTFINWHPSWLITFTSLW